MYLGSETDRPVNIHEALQTKVSYLAYPPPTSPEILRYQGKCHTRRAFSRGDRDVVFVGGIPLSLPLAYIPWVLDALLQEYAVQWVLQTQTNGCAKVWLEPEVKEELVGSPPQTPEAKANLPCSLLFDVCGVWIARDEVQIAALQQYNALTSSRGSDPRLPRYPMRIQNILPPKIPYQSAHSRPALFQSHPPGAQCPPSNETPFRFPGQ